MKRLMIIVGAFIAAVLWLHESPVFAQTPKKKIVLVPFTVFAGEDLAYLQKGINQMLASRLSHNDKVEVLQADSAKKAKAADPIGQAKAMGADYLVTGSLTLLGNSVSTDAKVLDLQQDKQVLSFNQVGKDKSVIIDHVDQFAAKINTELFGAPPPQQPSANTVPTDKESATPSIYQHPEKLITQPAEGVTASNRGTGPAVEGALLMRGRRLDFQLRGVATGDVDGDGQIDIVGIGPSNVVVYGITQNQFVKKADYKGKGGHYVGVSAMDVNGNGKAEIFVTNFYNNDSRVTSFVLEWDGKSLGRIAKNLNWYYRAVDVPDRGKILAGQRQGIDDPFAGTIHEIGWQGGSYGPVERLPLPRGLNIYGFAYGNVRSPADTEVVAYNPGGFVRILGPRGDEKWITSERYGGSHLYIEFPDKTDRTDRKYVYLSPQIYLHDLDGDGIKEIFVIKNKDVAGAFDRVRLFKHGRVEGLKWDELGMTSQWQTRNLAKYISDFAFIDVDGDGQSEVLASVVQKAGNILSKVRSYMAVFKLSHTPKKKEG